MEVRRAEALGRAWLLSLKHGNWELTARTTDGPPPAEGSRAAVLLDLTRAHLFDPATGRALLAGDGAVPAPGGRTSGADTHFFC
jgi:hypothetical protein